MSRRIEREAGSVYRINGKEARAKDVQLLFADQSTGARSPSMVGQGRIGELIQAKPQARRALLEEAAGISGLHTRRHEAELRLRAAEQNLERLDDVVGELESQIESLKRQARQASRFKNLSADIRKAEATLLHLRWTLAKAQEGEAQSALCRRHRRSSANAPPRRWTRPRTRPSARIACRNCATPRPRPPPPSSACRSPRRRSRRRPAAFAPATPSSTAPRCSSSTPTSPARSRWSRDNADILQRLDAEEATLNAGERRSPPSARRRRAARSKRRSPTLAASEAALAALTAERAEAAAARNQLERTLRETAERRDRLDTPAGRRRAARLAEIAAQASPALPTRPRSKRSPMRRRPRSRRPKRPPVPPNRRVAAGARRGKRRPRRRCRRPRPRWRGSRPKRARWPRS